MNNVQLKRFSELYPDYQTFKLKVIDRVINMHAVLPAYLDDTKLVYTLETVYKFMHNKYSRFFSRNDDEKQHDLMVNAMQELLPALYMKSLRLSADAINKLTIDDLLATIQRSFNEDPDTNYATTETSYTSTPVGNEAAGTFAISKPKDKNVINRKDKTVKVRQFKNLLDKYKTLGDIDASGLVMAFVNDMVLSSLWYMTASNDTVYVIEGKDGIAGKDGRDGYIETKGAFRDIDGTIHNKLYYVLDMDGINGFVGNEHGYVYVDSTGNVSYEKTWEEIKKYVDSQLLLTQADIGIVEEDLDKLTEKVDDVISDVNDLATQVQSIENTWTGSQGFGGTNPAEPEIDLKTLTGDKGAFDFTSGKKMLVKITLNNTLYSAEHLMRVGDHSSFHIGGRKLEDGETIDVTFTLSLNTNGILKMTDFHSSGTANQNAFFLRLELIEQNPKVVAVIDAYTKAEADAKYEPRDYDFSDIDSPLTYNLTSGKRYQIITKPSGADLTPVGATNRIVLKVTTTDATQLPQDADQITYDTDLVWIVKANGDIMTWGEIKDNVTAKKIMVIKHLSDGNWELIKWEDKPVEKADKTSVYTKTESDAKYATKTELASAGDTSWKTSKQDTLTKTLTLHWDDGTTEDIKVG